jgi:plasmid stabilization system protein ParE
VKVTLHPAAEADIAEAAAYYASNGSPSVAARFVVEFRRVAALLAEFPELGSPRSDGRRGFSMSIFPYTVLYRANGDGILVLVVKHDSRRPGYGAARK